VQEIEVLQKVQALSNPNVLSFVAAHEDVSATTGLPRLTIVTELCTGGEVRERRRLRSGKEPQTRLLRRVPLQHVPCICCSPLEITSLLASGACVYVPAMTFLIATCRGLRALQLFDRVVSRGHYSEKDAAELIAKLARALQQCHESGIVHRYVTCRRGASCAVHDAYGPARRFEAHDPVSLVTTRLQYLILRFYSQGPEARERAV
jgi:serine/threonine protein kinase